MQLNPDIGGWHAGAARRAAQGALAMALLPLIHEMWPLPQPGRAAVAIMAVMLVPVGRLGSSGLVPVSRRIALRVLGCACGAAFAGVVLLIAQGSALILIIGSLGGGMLGRH